MTNSHHCGGASWVCVTRHFIITVMTQRDLACLYNYDSDPEKHDATLIFFFPGRRWASHTHSTHNRRPRTMPVWMPLSVVAPPPLKLICWQTIMSQLKFCHFINAAVTGAFQNGRSLDCNGFLTTGKDNETSSICTTRGRFKACHAKQVWNDTSVSVSKLPDIFCFNSVTMAKTQGKGMKWHNIICQGCWKFQFIVPEWQSKQMNTNK